MTDINHGRSHRVADASLVRAPADAVEMRISDADRNGTLRRLHNAVALGLIDIDEFETFKNILFKQPQINTSLASPQARGFIEGGRLVAPSPPLPSAPLHSTHRRLCG